jgi:hypothetical protein
MSINRLFKKSDYSAEPLKALGHKVYYVGLPKTGSSSIYAMLYNFGSNHEFLFGESMNTIWMRSVENLPDDAWCGFIEARNKASEFKPDISTFNHYFIPHLSQNEHAVKYIYCFRDCKPWLNSFVNFIAYQLANLPPEIWHDIYVDLIFEMSILKPEFTDIEKVKEKAELFIPILINYWIVQNNKILDFIANKDALLLRTKEISACATKLADFLSINFEMIDITRTHENKGPNTTDWAKEYIRIFDAYSNQIKQIENKFELLAGKN